MAKLGFFINRSINGIPLGVNVRKQFNKQFIFRTRRGHGYHGSVEGRIYHDKMTYFVPGSINNVQGEPYRRQWIAAVHKWKYDLTAEQKREYDIRASKGLRMSGYNLFMRKAMKGEIQMYVDRGDPASADWTQATLIMDGHWHNLNLSPIVPAGAKLVLLRVLLFDTTTLPLLQFRKGGNVRNLNIARFKLPVTNSYFYDDKEVACDANRIIQYKTPTGVEEIQITVAGWWT